MPVQTRTKIVTFFLPFRFDGFADQLPAGSYLVETDEATMLGFSTPAQHIATFFRLPQSRGPSSREHSISIDPADLDSALAQDRTQQEFLKNGAEASAQRGTKNENA